MLPVLLALDGLCRHGNGEWTPLTRVARVYSNPLRLEVLASVLSAKGGQDLNVMMFLESGEQDSSAIAEAAATSGLVVGRLSPDARIWIENEKNTTVLDATVVGDEADHIQSLTDRSSSGFRRMLGYSGTRQTPQRQVVVRNYAREFPLEDPVLRRYFLVQRHSVNHLLTMYEKGSGPHVWCSVRRSGKTTAAVDLAGITGRSLVTVQTMDPQPHAPELNIFSDRVEEVLQQRRSLDRLFFQKVVQECVLASAPLQDEVTKRVFVIDEYESLFGHLGALAREDDVVKYGIVQPLLSQMVSFSVSNLLIFLGQQPDAHHILMAQNQLSPLVRQGKFPLFDHAHGAESSEFSLFVQRVLTERLPQTPDFADAVFAESSGHPYLTVNILVDFCQWLIERETPTDGLRVGSVDFEEFASARLSGAALRKSPYYGFFQNMLSEYLSESARESEPWLYAVATSIQRLATQHPKTFTCAVPRFSKLASDLAATANVTPDSLLRSAEMANFLRVEGGQVSPAIKIMGRLAGTVLKEVN